MILHEQTACGDSPETKLDLLARIVHLESWLHPFTSFLGSRLRITNCSDNISLLPVNIFPTERQGRSHPVTWQAHIWSYKCDSTLTLCLRVRCQQQPVVTNPLSEMVVPCLLSSSSVFISVFLGLWKACHNNVLWSAGYRISGECFLQSMSLLFLV